MKKMFTSLLSGPRCFLALTTIVGCALLLTSVTTVSAQSGLVAVADAAVLTVAPVSKWKTPVDCAAIIATERTNTATLLTNPALLDPEIALYQGYDRLLSYMQADLAAKIPMEDIVTTVYKKVLAEAPTDPILKDMSAAGLGVLYDGLLVQLAP